MTDTKLRIAVSGSRTIGEFESTKIEKVLSSIPVDPTSVIFKHGGANGVDTVAHHTAVRLGWTVADPFIADWTRYGKPAGPIRNREMLDSGVDILLAFPASDSIGTWDCIRAAVERKILVRIYPL